MPILRPHTARYSMNGASLAWRLRGRISTVILTYAGGRGPRANRFVRFWASGIKVHKNDTFPVQDCRWTAEQNFTPLALSAAEKSVIKMKFNFGRGCWLCLLSLLLFRLHRMHSLHKMRAYCHRRSCVVCVSVCVCWSPLWALQKNGWTDRDADWRVELSGPKESCIRWRSTSQREGEILGFVRLIEKD